MTPNNSAITIQCAGFGHLEVIYQVVQKTISEIYPGYYPSDAVRYFASLHSRSTLEANVRQRRVLVARNKDVIAGTATIRKNDISRLFVLPEPQKQGIGSLLMDSCENHILEDYSCVEICASLPSIALYEKRGYTMPGWSTVLCPNGDYLCYPQMRLARRDSLI